MSKILQQCFSTGFVLLLVVASVFPSAASFTDLSSDNPYYESALKLKQMAIVKGNPDGSLDWQRILNRAELTALVIRAANIQPDASDLNCFPDVKEQWFAGAVCAAKKRQIISGYQDGRFGPSDQVTAGQAAKIMLNALTDNQFQELPEALSFVENKKLFFETLENSQALQRGEAIERLARIIDSGLMTPKFLDQVDSEGNPFDPETDTITDFRVGSPEYLLFDVQQYELQRGERPLVLFFWASWCPLCRRSDQVIQESFADLTGNAIIYKLNYDDELELRKEFGITYQDTFIVLDEDGEEVGRKSGVKSLEEIQGLLDSAVAQQ